jgi:hypothetical protein
MPDPVTSSHVLEAYAASVERAVAAAGGQTRAIKPGHRIPFNWPPDLPSHRYHLRPDQWKPGGVLNVRGEDLTFDFAETDYGFFGRVEHLHNEALAENLEDLKVKLAEGCSPWFDRMEAIGRALGLPGRFRGSMTELTSDSLVTLLTCPDRDVAATAVSKIERRASEGVFLPSFLAILREARHPYRRIGQWCVLDMLEDHSAFAKTESEVTEVCAAIRDMMWDNPDDYARVVYKAGVVLGGHIVTPSAADALMACLNAPSRYARRSAMHAVFHLAEWMPERRIDIVAALKKAEVNETEPLLRAFAGHQARDVENQATDHVQEPVFPDEP